ncbi:hypothetical protein Aph01nite_08160 [Acrocarpospora phusangensis]|uniref:Uncharacterized protein n=1 Tax=Acrocarpospora phusangensis TaxID=1070424 RepID=A0A919Q6J5_9ACTN|nr:hypothetical protein Aph01nite_08160 [Acrocarpospora phusangensis]
MLVTGASGVIEGSGRIGVLTMAGVAAEGVGDFGLGHLLAVASHGEPVEPTMIRDSVRASAFGRVWMDGAQAPVG